MAEELVAIVLEKLSLAIYENGVKMVLNVENGIQDLENKLKSIQAVLEDAERRQVKEETTVKIWLQRLKDVAYDMDDLLDEWNTEVFKSQVEDKAHGSTSKKKKVRFIVPFRWFGADKIVRRHDIGKRIKELNNILDKIIVDKNIYHLMPSDGIRKFDQQSVSSDIFALNHRRVSTSDFDETEVHGRVRDKEKMVMEVLKGSSEKVTGLSIVSIVGMGGLGKTTLAQLAYNDNKVKSHFDVRVWICVSNPFDGRRICNAIVEALDKGAGKFEEMENLSQHIKFLTREKKVLLVLDDVWTDRYEEWEPVKNVLQNCGAKEVKIVVTTRKEVVADMMYSKYKHHLKGLSDEESWSMFSRIAFSAGSMGIQGSLDKFKQDVVQKCRGLPLAVKTLANLLRLKRNKEQWQSVLNDHIWKQKVVEDYLSPALLLSYYDLPPPIKRCFSYCAVYPKDFVIDREKLIQSWMAQGFLGLGQDVELEERGNEYFEELVGRSFFQDFVKDKIDGSVLRCKMHDIVHDLAQYLAKDECLTLEELNTGKESNADNFYSKARHLSIVLAQSFEFPGSLGTVKNLRTLLMYTSKSSDVLGLSELVHQLKCLRALSFSRLQFEKLPVEVSRLKHLRCLSICRNYDLKELPAAIFTLYNLQTLDLSNCSALVNLPQEIEKLVNLRYLDIKGTRIQFLPKGVGRLTSLRRLSAFLIGREYNDDACRLQDLRSLKKLQGQLDIRLLKYAKDMGEAEEAELKSITDIKSLNLRFGFGFLEYVGEITKDEQVLEALEPPSLLKSLAIWEYEGFVLPKWLMSLTNLRKLFLYRCINIESLPPLGKLPLLEELRLKMIWGLETLGPELFGLETVPVNSLQDAYPNLKNLKLERMNIREWKGITKIDDVEGNASTISLNLPSLRYFKLNWCESLQSLPHFILKAPLEKLKITGCPILEHRCKREEGDYWPRISHIPTIIVNGQYVQRDDLPVLT